MFLHKIDCLQVKISILSRKNLQIIQVLPVFLALKKLWLKIFHCAVIKTLHLSYVMGMCNWLDWILVSFVWKRARSLLWKSEREYWKTFDTQVLSGLALDLLLCHFTSHLLSRLVPFLPNSKELGCVNLESNCFRHERKVCLVAMIWILAGISMHESFYVHHLNFVIFDQKHLSGSVNDKKPWSDGQNWQDCKTVLELKADIALKMFCDPVKFGLSLKTLI